jgi:hypothetical protein
MKEKGRLGKSQKPARKRTSREGAAVPREAWSARLSWRLVRVRAAVAHAFAHTRDRARVRVGDLGRRVASARARLVWRLKRETDSTSGLARPALVSVGVAGLAFLAFGTPWSALSAGGWTFAIALLLALRAAQHRNAVAVQHELYELRQQLHVTQALIQVDELEDAEEVDLHDEPTRAGPAPKASGFGWRKRLGLPWPASR